LYYGRESNPHEHYCSRDFLTNYNFRCSFRICSLDFISTISLKDLGHPRQVSTRSLSGFARYCHFTGFTEFEDVCNITFQL